MPEFHLHACVRACVRACVCAQTLYHKVVPGCFVIVTPRMTLDTDLFIIIVQRHLLCQGLDLLRRHHLLVVRANLSLCMVTTVHGNVHKEC